MTRILISVVWILAAVQSSSAQIALNVEFLDETFEFDREDPFTGRWFGRFEAMGQQVFVELIIDPASDGEHAAEVVVPQIGLFGEKAVEMKLDGHLAELRFHRHEEGEVEVENVVTMSVTISDDGQWLEGDAKFNSGFDPSEAIAVSVRMQRVPRIEELKGLMAFSGAIKQTEGEMPLVIVMGQTQKGAWQGLIRVTSSEGISVDMPVLNLKRVEDDVSAQLLIGSSPVDLAASLVDDEQRLVGTVRKYAWSTELNFARDDGFLDRFKK